ncbi:MAG: dihydrolipoyl dehydrogenase [Formivibrio sp.]|nr:dihydrolipoyl dehydrogenase [Formivibrio sp.]
MSNVVEIKVPDIGGHDNVDVIEVFVKPGDQIAVDDSLITLETDKASMEVPSTAAGIVKEVKVKVGDKISEGGVVVLLEAIAQGAAAAAATASVAATAASAVAINGELVECDVMVLGAGPGGYTAAFRSSDLGKRVVLVEYHSTLGGVCLNVGCIPSKALLHVAKVMTDAEEMREHGLEFDNVRINIDKLRGFKDGVVARLTKGLAGLAKQRKVTVVNGWGKFTSPYTIEVTAADGTVKTVKFKNAIIAAGSQPTKVPGYPYEDSRIITSTGALQLKDVPKRLLVVGGGIIGLEMACVFSALGSKINVVELGDGLVPGADRDVIKVLTDRIGNRYESIMTKTKVAKVEAKPEGLLCTFEGDWAPAEPQLYDKILVAVGRRPNGQLIGAENAGIAIDERGFISIDNQCRTNVPHIFAIGDITGNPMLAHKATHEGKCAAEVIAGQPAHLDFRAIPAIAYTDPEVAWVGLTETEAKAKGIPYEKAVFPWAASGRALGNGRDDGLTKILVDPETKRILGTAIVGVNAGELLGEAVLAYEMGADIEDIAMTVHAHPTMSETMAFAAEMAHGSITDLYIPKKK